MTTNIQSFRITADDLITKPAFDRQRNSSATLLPSLQPKYGSNRQSRHRSRSLNSRSVSRGGSSRYFLRSSTSQTPPYSSKIDKTSSCNTSNIDSIQSSPTWTRKSPHVCGIAISTSQSSKPAVSKVLPSRPNHIHLALPSVSLSNHVESSSPTSSLDAIVLGRHKGSFSSPLSPHIVPDYVQSLSKSTWQISRWIGIIGVIFVLGYIFNALFLFDMNATKHEELPVTHDIQATSQLHVMSNNELGGVSVEIGHQGERGTGTDVQDQLLNGQSEQYGHGITMESLQATEPAQYTPVSHPQQHGEASRPLRRRKPKARDTHHIPDNFDDSINTLDATTDLTTIAQIFQAGSSNLGLASTSMEHNVVSIGGLPSLGYRGLSGGAGLGETRALRNRYNSDTTMSQPRRFTGSGMLYNPTVNPRLNNVELDPSSERSVGIGGNRPSPVASDRDEALFANPGLYGSYGDADVVDAWELMYMDRLRISRAPEHTPFHVDEYRFRTGITAYHVLQGLDGINIDVWGDSNTTSSSSSTSTRGETTAAATDGRQPPTSNSNPNSYNYNRSQRAQQISQANQRVQRTIRSNNRLYTPLHVSSPPPPSANDDDQNQLQQHEQSSIDHYIDTLDVFDQHNNDKNDQTTTNAMKTLATAATTMRRQNNDDVPMNDYRYDGWVNPRFPLPIPYGRVDDPAVRAPVNRVYGPYPVRRAVGPFPVFRSAPNAPTAVPPRLSYENTPSRFRTMSMMNAQRRKQRATAEEEAAPATITVQQLNAMIEASITNADFSIVPYTKRQKLQFDKQFIAWTETMMLEVCAAMSKMATVMTQIQATRDDNNDDNDDTRMNNAAVLIQLTSLHRGTKTQRQQREIDAMSKVLSVQSSVALLSEDIPDVASVCDALQYLYWLTPTKPELENAQKAEHIESILRQQQHGDTSTNRGGEKSLKKHQKKRIRQAALIAEATARLNRVKEAYDQLVHGDKVNQHVLDQVHRSAAQSIVRSEDRTTIASFCAFIYDVQETWEVVLAQTTGDDDDDVIAAMLATD